MYYKIIANHVISFRSVFVVNTAMAEGYVPGNGGLFTGVCVHISQNLLISGLLVESIGKLAIKNGFSKVAISEDIPGQPSGAINATFMGAPLGKSGKGGSLYNDRRPTIEGNFKQIQIRPASTIFFDTIPEIKARLEVTADNTPIPRRPEATNDAAERIAGLIAAVLAQ